MESPMQLLFVESCTSSHDKCSRKTNFDVVPHATQQMNSLHVVPHFFHSPHSRSLPFHTIFLRTPHSFGAKFERGKSQIALDHATPSNKWFQTSSAFTSAESCCRNSSPKIALAIERTVAASHTHYLNGKIVIEKRERRRNRGNKRHQPTSILSNDKRICFFTVSVSFFRASEGANERDGEDRLHSIHKIKLFPEIYLAAHKPFDAMSECRALANETLRRRRPR